jgi:hypothetical protein
VSAQEKLTNFSRDQLTDLVIEILLERNDCYQQLFQRGFTTLEAIEILAMVIDGAVKEMSS